ncbi:MAG: gamma-glutamylcyclotransferase family protein [Actinomycetota bacterium]
MPGRRADKTGDQLPLFVYGTLRRGERAAHLLAGAVRARALARARGARLALDLDYPAVSFAGDQEVEGELVWLDPQRFDVIMALIDDYEGAPDLFERVQVMVATDHGEVEAHAYEWRGRAAP